MKSPEQINASIAENMRAARKAADLTSAALAEAMADAGFPWHPQTVSNIETGPRRVTAAELVHLAEILGTTITRLVGDGSHPEVVSAPRIPDPRERPWLTVTEVATMTGEGEKVIRAALDAGHLPLLQVGRYKRIPTAAFRRLVDLPEDGGEARDLAEQTAGRADDVVAQVHRTLATLFLGSLGEENRKLFVQRFIEALS